MHALESSLTVKPRLRGVSHEIAFFAAPALSAALLVAAHTERARIATAIYAVAMSGLFGVSALFHRRTWGPAGRLRMRRLDHSMIFLAIAGTYTAVVAPSVSGRVATAVLVLVWAGAVGGIVGRLVRTRPAPKWLVAIPYVALGWVAVAVIPELWRAVGGVGVGLVVLGGLLYTAGAVVYTRRRPDPVPTVFGYHEVFHAFVLAGAAAHYAAVLLVVLPRA